MAKKKTTGKAFAEIKREEAATYEKQKALKVGKLQKARITARKRKRVRKPKFRKKTPRVTISGVRRVKEIQIVSRKGQPSPFAVVERLPRKSYLTSVSSSWLSTIGFLYGGTDIGTGTFTTKTGRQYKIYDMEWDDFEKWYYAHSKGTFFNDFIRDQYENQIKGTL